MTVSAGSSRGEKDHEFLLKSQTTSNPTAKELWKRHSHQDGLTAKKNIDAKLQGSCRTASGAISHQDAPNTKKEHRTFEEIRSLGY